MARKGRKGKQGFASMDPERQREIARLGGKTAQSLGKAHRFTQEEARKAGAKGGRASLQRRVKVKERRRNEP